MSKVSKKRIDKRLFDVLTSKNEKITLSKEEAFSHLEKVIGDIDGRY